MNHPFNPFFIPNPQQIRMEEEERNLKKAATYIGVLSISLTAVMESAFTILVLALINIGVLNPEQLDLPYLGVGNTAYMLIYIGVYVFALLVPAVVVSFFFKKRYFPISPAKPVRFSVAFLGIIGAVGLCMLSNIINSYLITIFTEVGLSVPEAPQTMENTIPSLALNLFTMAVLPALLEEMIYRGYILRTLRSFGNVFAVIVSSALFSLMHGNLRQIPFAFIVGLVLGYLYVITDNIWMPIAVHFTNNAFSVLMEYAGFYLPEDRVDVFYAMAIYGLLFVGIIAAILLLVRYKRDLVIPKVDCALPVSKRVSTLLTAPLFLISVILYAIILILGA